MKQQSMRAKRMARSHKRKGQASALNLTALMDIFTILVFFLMVNSGDTQVLKNTDDIVMPVSIAEQQPKDALILQVSQSQLIVGGKFIVEVEKIQASEDDVIAELKSELDYQASRRTELTDEEELYGRALTIQGSNEIPYSVLKKIMTTAAESDYRDLALAVTQQLRATQGE